MSDPFIGEVKLLSFNFPPRGWNICDGQLLPIGTYSTVFSLIGTTYGGDGRTSFALPDLRGRAPISKGTGPGLPPKEWGQRGGNTVNALNVLQMPSHNHALNASNLPGTAQNPQNAFMAGASAADFTGEVPSGIPVTGTVKVGSKNGTIDSAATSESRTITGSVTPDMYSGTANTQMNALSIGNTGGSQAFSIESPYLSMLYVFAMTGIYPPRN